MTPVAGNIKKKSADSQRCGTTLQSFCQHWYVLTELFDPPPHPWCMIALFPVLIFLSLELLVLPQP